MKFSTARAKWSEQHLAISALRQQVFIDEQGVSPEIEMDGKDEDPATQHFLGFADDRPVATGRVLTSGKLGRICILKEFRGQGFGKRFLHSMLQVLLETSEQRGLYLHAQVHALAFYEQCGFVAEGEVFQEAGIDHKRMALDLDQASFSALAYGDSVIRCNNPEQFSRHLGRMILAGVRTLDILSTSLSENVYTAVISENISAFVRRHRAAKARILVRDTRHLPKRLHPLVSLSQRLPSSVKIKMLTEPPQKPEQGFASIDRCGLIFFNDEENMEGFANYRARAESANALEEFERLWQQHSAEDLNLARLSL